MKLILKLVIACILCTMLVCGGVSAASSTDCLRVELIYPSCGMYNSLILNDVCITDCDGNQFAFIIKKDLDSVKKDATVDLSGSGLNCKKPFKEVILHLMLTRIWDCVVWSRDDMFTLDVTDLVTKTGAKSNTVLLKADNHFKIGQADAVDIFDCDGNLLKHFGATHDDGCYGSWDYSLTNYFRVEVGGDLGVSATLYLNGVCITDHDGHRFESFYEPGRKGHGVVLSWERMGRNAVISFPRSVLNCDKPFKEVKLHFTLKRKGADFSSGERWDKFSLDVTGLITKTEGKPDTFLLKAYNHYKFLKKDAVDIYDCNNNLLKHFGATWSDGSHGSWD